MSDNLGKRQKKVYILLMNGVSKKNPFQIDTSVRRVFQKKEDAEAQKQVYDRLNAGDEGSIIWSYEIIERELE